MDNMWCTCAGTCVAVAAEICGSSEAHHQGFSPGTPVSSPTSLVNGLANEIKLK